MRGLGNGIAHVSYEGGGLFLPARSPYDRQLLVELAVERVRTKGVVQILVDHRRWMLHPATDRPNQRCATCRCQTAAVWSRAAGDPETYCVRCAVLGSSRPPSEPTIKSPRTPLPKVVFTKKLGGCHA